jgi:hypothetical protein
VAIDLQLISDPNLDLANRLMPVRFARAVSGTTDKRAPDIDDRGFILPPRFGSARGPVVGVMRNKTVRILVVRDRIDANAEIYVTSEDETIASVEHPAAGQALNTADVGATDSTPERKANCIYLNGSSTSRSTQETKVLLRYGAADGPVIAELAVRVMPILVVRVQAHSVAINTGNQAVSNFGVIRDLFRRVNHIYAQAGVYFRLSSNLRNETITGFARNDSVTLSNVSDSRNVELQTVLNTNPRKNHLNAYFIRQYVDIVPSPPLVNGTLGIAFSSVSANANPASGAFPGTQAGITAYIDADRRMFSDTVAHEIGHALTLNHTRLRGAGGNPADIWSYRTLMYYNTGLAGSIGIDQIGYGRLQSGQRTNGTLITTKRWRGVRESDQVNRIRRAVLNGTYKPVRLP